MPFSKFMSFEKQDIRRLNRQSRIIKRYINSVEKIKKFDDICTEIINNHESSGVGMGKMMSAPALQYKDKVFAFYKNERMTFKLDPATDLNNVYGIKRFELLSPFKNKSPLKGWFIVPEEYSNVWTQLAEDALAYIRK